MNERAQNLTPRQESFCLAYLRTNSGADAYRDAYSTENMKPATIHRRAFDLLENGKIQARLAELRAPAIESAQLTLGGHLETLAELRDEARKAGNLGAAVTAEKSRGQAAGLYVTGPAVAIQVNNNTHEGELDGDLLQKVMGAITDEELERECLSRGMRVVPSKEFEQEIKALFQEL